MTIPILMPALSPTMTEGNLARWVKKEGEEVRAGDVIAEIETDKATMEVEAVDEGRLGKILVPEGSQGVKVNDPIALLLEAGEDASALAAAPAKPEAAPPAAKAPERAPVAAPRPEVPPREAPPREAPPERAEARLFASPLARRMAQEAGLDLAEISGTGPGGRIVKADIEAALSARRAPAEAAPAREAPVPPPSLSKARVVALAGNLPYRERPLTQMRRIIAQRLSLSKRTVPHFYLSVDCEIDELLKIRARLNARSEADKLTLNDFVIRAAALALRQVPEANASWSEEAILLWGSVDIAVAVALEEGLIAPIVKGAERKGLLAIAREMRDLVARAREGKLKLEEFQGGTFSLSNLGMYGVKEFAAVINPPHGAILAVGAGEKRPVVKEGALAVATVMTATLSCDHRVVDGATGARFLAAFKKLVEDPLTMLL
jgi:pyruvate dehydrogenase E2 component (dihydrolipoyllysine-residue acetyltransferase)